MVVLSKTLSRAFTLLEMLVTVTIIAVFASVVAPMFGDNNGIRLIAASSVLVSDIELAQVMTISFPDEPVVVRFDAGNQSYWLAYASDPDTPIARSDTGEPYFIAMGQGRALSAAGVSFTVEQMTADMLEFNAQGGLNDFSVTPSIELNCHDRIVTLTVSPATGTVTQTDGGGDLEEKK